jgi:hypothetical protein
MPSGSLSNRGHRAAPSDAADTAHAQLGVATCEINPCNGRRSIGQQRDLHAANGFLIVDLDRPPKCPAGVV